MIHDYFVNPELLGYENEEDDFPDFFKTFLDDNHKNIPFPHSGDTAMHLAIRNGRIR